MILCVLGYFLWIIVLTGYSFALKKHIYSRFLPLFIIAAFTDIGYLCLLTGTWKYIIPLLKAGGIFLFFYYLFFAIKGKREFREKVSDTVCNLYFFYFLSTALFFMSLIYEIVPASYDNFNHWLLYPKYITLNGKLGCQSELTHYLNYYPGCPIWQSIFSSFLNNSSYLLYSFFAARLVALSAVFFCFIPTGKITGKLNIYYTLLALGCVLLFFDFTITIGSYSIPNLPFFLLVSLFFVIIASKRDLSKRDRNCLLGFACLLFLFLQLNCFLIGSLVRLVVDAYMGFVLAAVIYFYWIQLFPVCIRYRNPWLFLWGLPVFFYFLLIKNTSLLLSLVFFIMSISWFFFTSKQNKVWKRILHYCLPFVFLGMTCFCLTSSWNHYLSSLQSQFLDFENQKQEMTISNVYKRLTDKNDSKTQQFIEDFFKGSVTTPMIGVPTSCSHLVSVTGFIGGTILISVFLLLFSPRYRRFKRDCIGFISVNFSFLLNFFLLLIGFIFLFNYLDNLTKPFTARYVAQFLYAWLFLYSALCFYYSSRQNSIWKRFFLCGIPYFIVFWIFAFSGTSGKKSIDSEIVTQKSIKEDLKIASKLHSFLLKDSQTNKTMDFNKQNVSYSVFSVKPSSAKKYFHPFYIRWFAIDDHGHFNSMSGFGDTPVDAIVKRKVWNEYQYILLMSLDEPSGMKEFQREMGTYLPKDYSGDSFLFRVKKIIDENNTQTFQLIPCKVTID